MASSVTPRRTQGAQQPSKGDLREQALLAAAERLLATGRFDAASVAELAGEAGISRASFYFYFASKQALLASVIDQAVSGFNARTIDVLAMRDDVTPAEALAASVRSAVDLWREHRTILLASFALGTTVPEVYERTMSNIAVVSEATVAFLREHGTVPEAEDPDEAERLVTALILMTERNLFDLMRGAPSDEECEALLARLARIWVRAFGLELSG